MAAAAASSSVADDVQSTISSFRNFSNTIGGRLTDSSTLGRGRGRFATDEVMELPEVGERTIYVTDEGLIVSIAVDLRQPEARIHRGPNWRRSSRNAANIRPNAELTSLSASTRNISRITETKKFMLPYTKKLQLLGDFVPQADSLVGLCPWTSLGDFRPPDFLTPRPEILNTPLQTSVTHKLV